jgi:large repetitive protein
VSLIQVEGLGALLDLATAIGLVKNGQLDDSWFSSPGDHVANMLREPTQRDALLRWANEILAHGSPPLVDDAGRHWVELFAEGPVGLHAVITVLGTTTEIGIGVRLDTEAPESHVRAYVPLLQVPANAPASVVLGQAAGRVEVTAEVVFDAGPPAPGEAGLQGLHIGAAVATDGTAPLLSLKLRGLQLPGQQTPSDVSLDGDPAQLGDQALRVILGLIQQAVSQIPAGVGTELAELFALLGISADTAIPPLPVADLFSRGSSAMAQVSRLSPLPICRGRSPGR